MPVRSGLSEASRAADDRDHANRGGGGAAANLARACTAEAVGTFLLVLVGTAVVIAATQGKGTAGPAYNSLAVALSFGLILVPIVASTGRSAAPTSIPR